MKIKVPCYKCFEEGSAKDTVKKVPYVPSYPYWEYPTIHLDKWPLIEFTCKKGHKTVLLLNYELYELLFQQATYCIMDGYYREAIATYNASLERYFEYCIEILLAESTSDNCFSDMWKEIKKQSERQLGAFYAIYTSKMNETPVPLKRKMVELRNDVVHNGKLVTEEEAREFGEYVYNYIKNNYKRIEEYLGDNISECVIKRRMRILNENSILKNVDTKQDKEITNFTTIGPCFLNDDRIIEYEDCFKPENQKSCGLIK